MTKRCFCFTFFLLICFSLPLTATAQTVTIPDDNLRDAIWNELGILPDDSPIPVSGMTKLTKLTAPRANITNLTGLEHATNLTKLYLEFNSISDVSPLAGLNNLTDLDLRHNRISDISPLVANAGLGSGDEVAVSENPLNHASITVHILALRRRGVEIYWFDNIVAQPVDIPDRNLRAAIENALAVASGATIVEPEMEILTRLVALNANISDLTGLEHATNLTALGLGPEQVQQGVWRNSNSITDISALQGLTKLEVLDLDGNSISNISALERLTNLTVLDLDDNNITDISPLSGLTNLEVIGLRENFISNISAVRGLTNLTRLELSGNPITDISAVAGLTNLTELYLRSNSITDISAVASLTNLTLLALPSNSITDISAVTGLTNLTTLDLDGNSITDISAVAGLTNLTGLGLGDNNISSISALEGLTNLRVLYLRDNNISDLSSLVANVGLGSGDLVNVLDNPLSSVSINNHIPALQSRGVTVEFDPVVAEPVDIPDPNLRAKIEEVLGKASGAAITTSDMATLTMLPDAENANITDLTGLEYATNLTQLEIWGNSISDISPLANLTNLTHLWLSGSPISDLSPLANLTRLTHLFFGDNIISDLAPLANLTNLTRLSLWNNAISDLSPLANLTNLTHLNLGRNVISDISPLARLTNLTELLLRENAISDISPLVANIGLGSGDLVDVSENPLNSVSINTHIPALQHRGVEIFSFNLKPTTSEYTLTMPAGISLIHVPLKVTAINRSPGTIESISELYDVLGGAGTVNFLITYDSHAQEWRSYFGASDKGGPADRVLTDDMGIIAGMIYPRTTHFSGNPLGINGRSTIALNQGLNLVGLPLNDSRIERVSDLYTLDGIGGNVPVIILTDGGEFKLVGRAGDPGDIEITGGQAFIMTASQDATVAISGDAWANDSGTAAAPPVTRNGIEVGDTTPVLGLRGAIVDEGTGLNNVGFRVTVKNLSTGSAVAAVTTPDEARYRSTVVDIETGRAATVGDVLEISAQSPNPFVGVEPLRYTVTVEDVKQSLIQLPELVSYEKPAETELLANYPNPFNPETWIPYRLAEDAFVTLTIYDLSGQVVRTIDVGHQIAAVYENRSKAVYWDGRNGLGEPVASGVYFYHLSAGDFSATRKMMILK